MLGCESVGMCLLWCIFITLCIVNLRAAAYTAHLEFSLLFKTLLSHMSVSVVQTTSTTWLRAAFCSDCAKQAVNWHQLITAFNRLNGWQIECRSQGISFALSKLRSSSFSHLIKRIAHPIMAIAITVPPTRSFSLDLWSWLRNTSRLLFFSLHVWVNWLFSHCSWRGLGGLTLDGTFIDQNMEGDGGKLNSQSELIMVMLQRID